MFIGICSRSQVSVYRTIGPLVLKLHFRATFNNSYIGTEIIGVNLDLSQTGFLFQVGVCVSHATRENRYMFVTSRPNSLVAQC